MLVGLGQGRDPVDFGVTRSKVKVKVGSLNLPARMPQSHEAIGIACDALFRDIDALFSLVLRACTEFGMLRVLF